MGIAVLIPTLGRAQKLSPLIANVHEATKADHHVYFIVESDDTETLKALRDQPVTVIKGQFGSCAAAMNEGYRNSSESFFVTANDDVRFHDGWDERALARMSDDKHVVGLNDGSGDCKCFTLVRRSYIEENSGVYDKPNTVYHPYQSQCCDTEFAFYAQLRGVWAEAPDAVVEHVHWRFGKADRNHPNYLKAKETNDADLATYNERREQWDPKHLTPDCMATT